MTIGGEAAKICVWHLVRRMPRRMPVEARRMPVEAEKDSFNLHIPEQSANALAQDALFAFG